MESERAKYNLMSILNKPAPYKPNALTAFGVLFIVISLIVPLQNLIVWGEDFVYDFYTSSEITAEKISLGVLMFGMILVGVGYKKQIFLEKI